MLGLGGLAIAGGATLFEHFSAEMLAIGGNHNSQNLAPAEGAMEWTDDCVWQVDDLHLSTPLLDFWI